MKPERKHIVEARAKLMVLGLQVDSVTERIKDIEWRLDFLEDNADMQPLYDARHRAVDKLRHLRMEQIELTQLLADDYLEEATGYDAAV